MAAKGWLEPEVTGADGDLPGLAYAFALGAIAPAECAGLAERLLSAVPAVRQEFDTVVRDTREAMAHIAIATAADPPAGLRARVLRDIRAGADTDSGLIRGSS